MPATKVVRWLSAYIPARVCIHPISVRGRCARVSCFSFFAPSFPRDARCSVQRAPELLFLAVYRVLRRVNLGKWSRSLFFVVVGGGESGREALLRMREMARTLSALIEESDNLHSGGAWCSVYCGANGPSNLDDLSGLSQLWFRDD